MPQAHDIIHVFNSALVSGPETLIVPNLAQSKRSVGFILLQESRLPEGAQSVYKYLISYGFYPTQLSVSGRFDVLAIYRLSRYLRTISRNTIIHTHGPKASLYVALACTLIRPSLRPTLVTTHHGVRATDTKRSLKFFEFIFEKIAMPFFKYCLTVCSSDLEILSRRGIQRTKLITHVNGTSRTLVKCDASRAVLSQSIRKQWATDYNCKDLTNTNAKIIGIVARLAIEKRHHLALEALKLVNDKNVYLLLFGSGPLLDDLRELSKKFGVQNHVIFAGYKNNISSELAGLDVMLSLSSAEGLPINLIESAWSSTPVVATSVDGVNDLIPSNDYGWRISDSPTAHEISTAVNAALFNTDDANGRALKLQNRVSDHFSTNSWNRELDNIYKMALS